MSARGGRRSGPYILLFLIVVFLVGGLMITAINPYWDGVEDSELNNFDTKWGQDLSTWFETYHAWLGLVGLFAILYTAFITTRAPE